jgi:hypothetical protein
MVRCSAAAGRRWLRPSWYQMRRGAPGILLSQLMCATCIGGWHDGGAVVSAPSPVGGSSSSGCPWLEELDGHKYLKLQQPNNASYHFVVTDDGNTQPAQTTSLYTRLQVAAIRADGIDVLLTHTVTSAFPPPPPPPPPPRPHCRHRPAVTQPRLTFSSSETASEASRSYALSHRRGHLLQIPPTMQALCAFSRTTRTRTNAGRLHLRRPCSAMIARTHRRRPLTSPVHLSQSRTEQPSGLPAMWILLVSWIRQQASSVLTATVSCLLSNPAINVQ